MDETEKIEYLITAITGNILRPDEMEEVLALCLNDYLDPNEFVREWEQQEGRLHIPAAQLKGSVLQYNLVNHEHCSWAFATGYDVDEVHTGLQEMLNGSPLPAYPGYRRNEVAGYATWLERAMHLCRPDLAPYAFLHDTIDDDGGMVVFTVERLGAQSFEKNCLELGIGVGPLSAVAALWHGNAHPHAIALALPCTTPCPHQPRWASATHCDRYGLDSCVSPFLLPS